MIYGSRGEHSIYILSITMKFYCLNRLNLYLARNSDVNKYEDRVNLHQYINGLEF